MARKLRELEATFLKALSDGSSQTGVSFAEADGILFVCPACVETNGGTYGTHRVICWFAGKVPDDRAPKGRWNPSGTCIDDLTFVPPGSVSVLLQSECAWHGLIENGEANTCP